MHHIHIQHWLFLFIICMNSWLQRVNEVLAQPHETFATSSPRAMRQTRRAIYARSFRPNLQLILSCIIISFPIRFGFWRGRELLKLMGTFLWWSCMENIFIIEGFDCLSFTYSLFIIIIIYWMYEANMKMENSCKEFNLFDAAFECRNN